MDIYIQKARELGNLILNSKEAKNLKLAEENFIKNKKAKEKFDIFKSYHNNITESLEASILSKEEADLLTLKLEDMAKELQSIKEIKEFLDAEIAFNNLTNTILKTINDTVLGEEKCVHKCNYGTCEH